MNDTPRTERVRNEVFEAWKKNGMGDELAEQTGISLDKLCRELERELTELRKDKARLDWILTMRGESRKTLDELMEIK